MSDLAGSVPLCEECDAPIRLVVSSIIEHERERQTRDTTTLPWNDNSEIEEWSEYHVKSTLACDCTAHTVDEPPESWPVMGRQ